MIRITVLCDNNTASQSLACEHGLSLFVEVDGRSFLFDTGQSGIFFRNSQLLGVDISNIDFVLLSHGHYDHAGGLAVLMEHLPKTRIMMHPNAVQQRFSLSSAMIKENGFPHINLLEMWKENISYPDDNIEPIPGVRLYSLPFDAVENHRLVVRSEKGEYIPDVFDDELFVVIDDGKNKVLLSGCTHHGIDNVLRYFAENRGIAGFDLVMGGLHLSGADPAEIKRQIEACKRYDIDKWALNHCTGDVAFELWKKAFGNGVSTASGGEIFQFS